MVANSKLNQLMRGNVEDIEPVSPHLPENSRKKKNKQKNSMKISILVLICMLFTYQTLINWPLDDVPVVFVCHDSKHHPLPV